MEEKDRDGQYIDTSLPVNFTSIEVEDQPNSVFAQYGQPFALDELFSRHRKYLQKNGN